MTEPTPDGLWRPGRSWGRTIVIQSGPEPRKGGGPDGDTLVGYAKGPDAKRNAQIACDAVNGHPPDGEPRWEAVGCLVFRGLPTRAPGPRSVANSWVMAMDTAPLARRVVDAVNGQVSDA